KHELKTILTIAISWTLVDFILFEYRKAAGVLGEKYYSPNTNLTKEIILREMNVFIFSLIIGYFLVSVITAYLRNRSLWFNLFIKTLILVSFAFGMNFFIYVSYEWLIHGFTLGHALNKFIHNMF